MLENEKALLAPPLIKYTMMKWTAIKTSFMVHNTRLSLYNWAHAQSGDLDVITTSVGRYAIPTISLIGQISISLTRRVRRGQKRVFDKFREGETRL